MSAVRSQRSLRQVIEVSHIPVVMVTALGEPGERIRGLEAGADDFLTKPVDYDTLMARVRSLVRLKRLLDEWRARGDTVRTLGLGTDRLLAPLIAGARALVVDDWDQSAQNIQDALTEDGVVAVWARSAAGSSSDHRKSRALFKLRRGGAYPRLHSWPRVRRPGKPPREQGSVD